MIFFPYGLEFTFGNRSWPLIVCNYLIIGFYGISQFNLRKHDILIKKVYFLTIPIFLILNLYSLYNYSLYKIYKKNLYYDFSAISEIANNTEGIKIYFDTSEETFYSYLFSGYVNQDFYYKLPKQIKKTSIIVIDNPINLCIFYCT